MRAGSIDFQLEITIGLPNPPDDHHRVDEQSQKLSGPVFCRALLFDIVNKPAYVGFYDTFALW